MTYDQWKKMSPEDYDDYLNRLFRRPNLDNVRDPDDEERDDDEPPPDLGTGD